jgi:uncharacterized protein
MRHLALLLLVIAAPSFADTTTTASGIPLDTPWKIAVHGWAVAHVKHSAWGLAHSERNYHTALRLAGAEQWVVDRDALFAAAFLHDVGGLAEFEHAGVDHAVRSVEVAEPLLRELGFPMERFPLVRAIILGHVYYGPPPTEREALAFRDADLLDFLGAIGVARLASATAELGHNPTLGTAFDAAEKMAGELPPKLSTASARDEAKARVAEMQAFIRATRAYSLDGTAF